MRDIYVACHFLMLQLCVRLLCCNCRTNFNMYLLFSVLTPYYNEDVLYSDEELNKENEDGITTLFYLQKIYPGECVIVAC